MSTGLPFPVPERFSGRTCGDCTLCCKVMGITELKKPAGTWCEHCAPGVGCKIYKDRPSSCAGFECLWLQGSPATVPDELKPNRCKAVIVPMKEPFQGFVVHADPGYPTAWSEGLLKYYIDAAVRSGLSVAIVVGKERYWFTNNEEEVAKIKEAFPGTQELPT